jgi:hypothetical protein
VNSLVKEKTKNPRPKPYQTPGMLEAIKTDESLSMLHSKFPRSYSVYDISTCRPRCTGEKLQPYASNALSKIALLIGSYESWDHSSVFGNSTCTRTRTTESVQ